MAMEKTYIVNVETGEVIQRELTAEELAFEVLEREKQLLIRTARELENATKATEKAALLAKLGITDDEAKLLLS
jgi:hypothetical protein